MRRFFCFKEPGSLAEFAAALAAFSLSVALMTACGSASGSSNARIGAGPLRVSGGGIAQFREPGGDNTIEEFGHEASRAELKAAARAVHGYLVALVREKWTAACAHLSRYQTELIEGYVSELRKPGGGTCSGSLKAYGSFRTPKETVVEATEVDAGSLRVDGNFGFLFFNAGQPNGRKLAIEREGGAWKAYGLYPTSLH